MSIVSEILRLQGAKADLKTAIESKGVIVSSETTLDGYAELVNQISSGSSQVGSLTKYKSVLLTPSLETYALLTNPMDVAPKIIVITAPVDSHARQTANYIQDVIINFDLCGAAWYKNASDVFYSSSLRRSETPNANGLFGFLSGQPTKIIIYRASGTIIWSTQTEYQLEFYA